MVFSVRRFAHKTLSTTYVVKRSCTSGCSGFARRVVGKLASGEIRVLLAGVFVGDRETHLFGATLPLFSREVPHVGNCVDFVDNLHSDECLDNVL